MIVVGGSISLISYVKEIFCSVCHKTHFVDSFVQLSTPLVALTSRFASPSRETIAPSTNHLHNCRHMLPEKIVPFPVSIYKIGRAHV